MSNVTPADTPPLPDGIGINMADMRALIGREHGIKLADDDPMLMMVTMNKAFLTDYEKLLARHHEAMKACLGEEVTRHLEAVQASTDKLTNEISGASLQRHGSEMRDFESNMKWLAVIVAVSAILNVAVFCLRAKGVI